METQDKIVERIGNMLVGVTLDKEHAKTLLSYVIPVIVCSGVKI